MPGLTHAWSFGVQAAEWQFPDRAKTWKIVYNPNYGEIPACITVFTKRRELHGPVQVALDPHFEHSMGRGALNNHGQGHHDLHNWINEAYQLADIHTHDHFVLRDNDVPDMVIIKAITNLVSLGHIDDPAYDVIQHLQSVT
ncbi:hypothetical protein [Microbulbifer sp. GL-2]|uniref:hypothetical protein n=1 Tax=Microbulbifer sp. GL-2 TaxID=2591606 RepID=UPI001162D418|nr:hypothetical protein [Microbulbifer sp. GL-2]BBM02594.1 hypothetical protein GL2_26680 [Microbulbifer sp. GL-2]